MIPVRLKQLEVGDVFKYTDKCDNDYVIDYTGSVIGKTTREWVACSTISKKRYNPETGHVIFNYDYTGQQEPCIFTDHNKLVEKIEF